MRALAAVVLAGCFHPTPREGDACEDGSRWCPSPLHCSPTNTCVTNELGPDGGNGAGGWNYAFVTSLDFDLTTLTTDDADMACNTFAHNHLPGTFTAWVSTSASPAIDRLDPMTAGWVRPDGRRVASDLQALKTGVMAYPIRLDENGVDHDAITVFTQTRPDGQFDGPDCSTGGSAMMGTSDATTNAWTKFQAVLCGSTRAHLYCLATDNVAPPPIVEPTASKLVFLSFNPISGQLGQAAMDQECRDEAAATLANKNPDDFIALVAVSALSPASRLTTGPWARPDGVTAIDATLHLVAPINMVSLDITPEQSRYVDLEVWGGATDFMTGATMASDDCTEWIGASTGLYGRSARTQSHGAFAYADGVCTANRYLYCAEK